MKNARTLFRWDLRSKHTVELDSYKTVNYQAVIFVPGIMLSYRDTRDQVSALKEFHSKKGQCKISDPSIL